MINIGIREYNFYNRDCNSLVVRVLNTFILSLDLDFKKSYNNNLQIRLKFNQLIYYDDLLALVWCGFFYYFFRNTIFMKHN